MDMGWTPAHCAAEAGRLTVIRALHAAGVPIDKKDKYGDPPRRIAEIYGHKDIVSFLILYVILVKILTLSPVFVFHKY